MVEALISFFQGFLTCAGLIIAIGPQNAFILKQGLAKNHTFFIAFFCALVDSLLIVIGTYGIGEVLSESQTLISLSKWLGGFFLLAYGCRSFFLAVKCPPSLLAVSQQKGERTLLKTFYLLVVFSFLNPYVYLDTIVLLGTMGSQLEGMERPLFTAGAVLCSIVWFFTLSYGARFLAPFLQSLKARRRIEIFIGIIMWLMGFSLLFGKV